MRPSTVLEIGRRFGRLTVIAHANPRISSAGRRRSQSYMRCDCGVERLVLNNSLTQCQANSCGCVQKLLGPENPHWKGGRRANRRGYVKIYRPENPNADSMGGVLEHRVVMEGIIGRFLFPDETVHHKNGIRSDNRLENLELWTTHHPYGQRASDLLLWAKEVIMRYNGLTAVQETGTPVRAN